MSLQDTEDEVVQDGLKRATIKDADADDANNNKLNHIIQLTGFYDPLYAEANVTIHRYNVVLDVTVYNRTKETLENLCLELATIGDHLKLVECLPQKYDTLAPESSKKIKANISVSSTDQTGVIFGNIIFETSNVLGRTHVVVLKDIHIDIMDYRSPVVCSHTAFRTIWAEENKVAVNTKITNEKGSLEDIMRSTNMKDLAAVSAKAFVMSVFGKDAFGEYEWLRSRLIMANLNCSQLG